MTPRPLFAFEYPPDFPPHGRSFRYGVVCPNRNRDVGAISFDPNHVGGARWRWSITVPSTRRGAPASGQGPSLEAALTAFRAAWDVFPDMEDWPPLGSGAWPGNNPVQFRGNGVAPGQGPWQPGREPRGWRST